VIDDPPSAHLIRREGRSFLLSFMICGRTHPASHADPQPQGLPTKGEGHSSHGPEASRVSHPLGEAHTKGVSTETWNLEAVICNLEIKNPE
jgi:hypothetical protein